MVFFREPFRRRSSLAEALFGTRGRLRCRELPTALVNCKSAWVKWRTGPPFHGFESQTLFSAFADAGVRAFCHFGAGALWPRLASEREGADELPTAPVNFGVGSREMADSRGAAISRLVLNRKLSLARLQTRESAPFNSKARRRQRLFDTKPRSAASRP